MVGQNLDNYFSFVYARLLGGVETTSTRFSQPMESVFCVACQLNSVETFGSREVNTCDVPHYNQYSGT